MQATQTSVKDGNQKWYIPKRYIFAFLGFCGVFNVYTMRVNINVALVAMVNHTKEELVNNSYTQDECPNPNHIFEEDTVKKNLKREQFNWDPKTQGYVMSSFFYGYVVTVLTGGFLAERFGAKRMLGGGVLITAVFTLLTPLAARWSLAPFLTLRAMEGIGEGLAFPAINSLIGGWSPKQERSRISASIFGGASLGTVVSLTISGWLCGTDFLGGWPSVFYVFGTIGCIWVVFWFIFIYETPHQHPGITQDELLLYSSFGDQVTQKRPVVYWKRIAFSVHFWAVLVSHAGAYFGQSLMIQEFPTYLSGMLRFSVGASGLVTGLPNVFECIGGWTSSYVADRLITSKKLSVTCVRKIFNSLAFYGAGLCILGIALSACDAWPVIVLFSLFLFLNGFKFSGYNVSHVDMCPPIAGTLYGFTNGVACLTGIIGPTIVGVFTSKGATLDNWNSVFYITVGVYFATGTFFATFASAEQQDWLEYDSDESDEDKKEITDSHRL